MKRDEEEDIRYTYTSIFKSGCLTWLQPQRLRKQPSPLLLFSINFAPNKKKTACPLPEKMGIFLYVFFQAVSSWWHQEDYESHLTCNGSNQFLTKGLKARRTMERRAPSKCSVGTSALNGLCVETAGCL